MAKKKEQTVSLMEKKVSGNIQDVVVEALLEKMGEKVTVLNLKKINHVFFDYFVVCTANSKPHADTLCDFVQEKVKKELGTRASFVEGTENKEWIILDYFNVIVHIFSPEAREYYNIEQLWSDAEIQCF